MRTLRPPEDKRGARRLRKEKTKSLTESMKRGKENNKENSSFSHFVLNLDYPFSTAWLALPVYLIKSDSVMAYRGDFLHETLPSLTCLLISAPMK